MTSDYPKHLYDHLTGLPALPRTPGALAELRTLSQNLINAVRDEQSAGPATYEMRSKTNQAIDELAHVLATNPGIGWASPKETDKLRTVINAADRVLGGRKSFRDIEEYRRIHKRNVY
jgi:hypothetical protein